MDELNSTQKLSLVALALGHGATVHGQTKYLLMKRGYISRVDGGYELTGHGALTAIHLIREQRR